MRNHFKDGLLLWPTVSQTPSVTSLRNELCTQISIQKNVNEEDVKMWLNQTLQQSRRIVLFLDYVWGGNARNLESLAQLKALSVQNNGETMNERTLGSMTKMDTLRLILTGMEFLPSDMRNMSMLRLFVLTCSHVVKMPTYLCDFQKMIHLTLYKCDMLEELPHLHKLTSLKQLEIVRCSKLIRLPSEFGSPGAFPILEIFSLVQLHELEYLHVLHKRGNDFTSNIYHNGMQGIEDIS